MVEKLVAAIEKHIAVVKNKSRRSKKIVAFVEN